MGRHQNDELPRAVHAAEHSAIVLDQFRLFATAADAARTSAPHPTHNDALTAANSRRDVAAVLHQATGRGAPLRESMWYVKAAAATIGRGARRSARAAPWTCVELGLNADSAELPSFARRARRARTPPALGVRCSMPLPIAGTAEPARESVPVVA